MPKPRRAELRLDPEDRSTFGHAGDAEREPPRAEKRRPEKPRKTAPPRRGGGRRLLGLLARWSLVAAIWGIVAISAVFGYFALTLPDTGDLSVAPRRPSVTLLAADNSLLATYGDLFGEPLRLKEIPRYLPEAVIATEDRRFYHHFGIDPVGLVRAAYVNWRAGHVVQGGSTLTQQLAKNLFLTPEKTTARKIQEALLALWLEHRFTKDQILEIYLNRVYLGAGAYGVDAAARRYFNKSARDLTVYESAILAGLLKAPTRFSPARDRERAAKRADQVLANMVDAGFLTEKQAAAAAQQRTQLAFVAPVRAGSRYFADWLIEFVSDFGGVGKQDLVVVTTLDPRAQAAAEAAVAETLQKDGPKAKASQAALVAMSPDGAVRAMVGGRDYGESQFNRATQAQRQPGSAFKPFVYLAALESGFTPGSRFVDGPIRLGNWSPHNYTGKYLGEVTMAEAVAESVNTVAVQVSERVGRAKVAAAARRLGISSDIGADASIALGTSEVSLLELTGAYAAFASGGTGAWPYGIQEIRDNRGKVLFRRSGGGPGRVIEPGVAAEMSELLSGVVARGTGRAAALPDRPAAGKTGTTQDYHDAWFVGYTAELVAGVWFGNDDNSEMHKVTGGTLPARTWKSFMLAATKGMAPRPLIAAPPPAAPAETPHIGGFSIDSIISAITGGRGGGNSAARAPAPAARPAVTGRRDDYTTWQDRQGGGG
jgi:penicillin-binding protein 1A